MKILICSDSHGLTDEFISLKKQHGDIDYYIHCGDSELSNSHPALDGYKVVKGNCDVGDDFPEELIVEAGKSKIFVTHGHLYNVKTTLMKLQYKAIEVNADIVCFGHSHVLGFEMFNGILFINPSSIAMPRMRKEKTYIILELADTTRLVSVYEYGKGKLFSETFDI
jgi:uncharacterized protein